MVFRQKVCKTDGMKLYSGVLNERDRISKNSLILVMNEKRDINV